MADAAYGEGTADRPGRGRDPGAGHQHARIALATLGFIGVLGAGFNGGSFLNDNEDVSSMLMAVGFALACSVALLDRSVARLSAPA